MDIAKLQLANELEYKISLLDREIEARSRRSTSVSTIRVPDILKENPEVASMILKYDVLILNLLEAEKALIQKQFDEL